MKKYYFWILLFFIILGFSDSVFLTYEHYNLSSTFCPISPWINCLAVTTSKYSEIWGIPLAILGTIYYLFMFFFLSKKQKMFNHFLLITSSFGVLFSLYLIYIQAFAIGLFCLYCLASALVSFIIFGLTYIFFKEEWGTLIIDCMGYGYKFVLKPILFLFDAELVHVSMVNTGEQIIKNKFVKNLMEKMFVKKYKNLEQNILDLNFKTPIGLAAGFDYEARLTQTLPYVGFGFQSVGTITNTAYQGNPAPRLGRLPKSNSILVNKGYKNLGIKETLAKLNKLKFKYPLGISIGRTNSAVLDTVDKSIEDIVSAFKTANKSGVSNSYYELNISCPNIIHDAGINFYLIKNLEKLLTAVDKLRLKKPLFIKMPIDQTDGHTLKMLKTISNHRVAGVIFGNLQTNKKNKVLVQSEVNKFKMGKYSGKPTFEDSNRLIRLAYKNFKNRFVIIGTGGVFNAEDAWVKFANGANLVQLITGMIFEGPQLIAQINRDLSKRIQKEGYKNIREIVGIEV